MNLDDFLKENLDDILDNSDKYVSSNKPNKVNKKVLINESHNNIFEIGKNNAQTKELTDIDNSDEKEYLEYNREYFDNSNEYHDINCINNDDDDNNYDNNNYDKYQTIISNEELTEDNCEDDIIDELYEKMHKSLQSSNNIDETFDFSYETNNNSIQDLIMESNQIIDTNKNLSFDDNGEYFFNLINIFIKYYNNKFDKVEHFFSNIKDLDKGTSYQMELFFDLIIEFKIFCEHMNLSTNKAMEHLYKETEPEKISALFEKWDKQIYMFELGELKMFSPSLIICLNYIYEKNILEENWNIYNLRND